MQFVKPIPFAEAIEKLGSKSSIGSDLSSSQWHDVPVGLRERAFFSSRIESIRFLDRTKGWLGDFLEKNVETLPNGEVALKMGGRAQFVETAREFAISEGMGPLSPGEKGTVKDITSQKRLELIFDTQIRQAQDFGYWKQGQDPDVLDAFPAQRFIRVLDVDEPREWHTQFENEVRLKSDLGFWKLVNKDFGVPWGPWGWGCGHDVEDVDREEAEALGLLKPGDQVQPVVKDFNDQLEASTKNLDGDMLQFLADAFGDQVEFVGDSVRWNPKGKPAGPAPAPAPAPTPTPSPTKVPAAPKPVSIGTPTLESVLDDIGLGVGKRATVKKITALRVALKEDAPLKASQVIKKTQGSQLYPHLSALKLEQDVQAFIDYVPADKARALPKLNVQTVAARYRGQYSRGGSVEISTSTIQDEHQRRRTMFHELMHWLHIEGPKEFKDAIKKHYQDRTKGEQLVPIGYGSSLGKKDKWYESYAGKVYEDAGDPIGYEVPTRYIEWLVMDPKEAARLWNRAEFRETITIVLRALF